MKVYTAHIDMPDWPINTVVCSTEEIAKEKVAAAIGFYIIDLIKDGEYSKAKDFIDSLVVGDNYYITDTKEHIDYYIEEHEVDNEILS